MPPAMMLPLLAAAALALTVVAFHRRLPPVMATRVTTVALVVVAASAVPTVWMAGIAYLAHAPAVGRWFDSCADALGGHHAVAPWVGIPALVGTAVGAWRTVGTVRAYRSVLSHEPGVDIVDDPELVAFTLPGRGGRVVLSSALRERLTDEEFDVVLAHERAHGRFRHDRYLLTAQVAAALLAPLRPLVDRVRFSIERWADEEAVRECGERRFVARTLGRVALYSADRRPVLAFAGLGVAARMAALMAPPTKEPTSFDRATIVVLVVLTALFAAFQIRHLAQMVAAFCLG